MLLSFPPWMLREQMCIMVTALVGHHLLWLVKEDP